MAETLTIALNCPKCGAGISIKERDRVVTCSYCNAEHFLAGIKGTVRSVIPFALTEGDAKKVVLYHFRKRETAQDIPLQGQLKEVTPIYVPFWRVREGYYGWRFTPGKRPQVLKRVAEVTVPACSTGGLGFTSVHMEPEDLEEQKLYQPELAQREAIVYDVTIPEQDVLELTKKRVLGKTGGRSSGKILLQRMKRISTSASLFYFPFWMVKYSYKGKLYQVVVNGRRGLVVSGRFPANLSARLAPILIASGLGGLLATSVRSVQVLDKAGLEVGPALHLIAGMIVIAGVAVFIQLFQAGLAALRYGREVRIEDMRRVDALPEYTGMLEELRGSLRELAQEVTAVTSEAHYYERTGHSGDLF
jgi:hypothetical protein